MRAIRRHYDRVGAELRPEPGRRRAAQPHPRGRAGLPAAPARRCGRSPSPGPPARTRSPPSPSQIDRRRHGQLETEWDERDIPVPLTILDSPYRDITGPVLDYVAELRRESPRDVVAVFIPEYVVGRWWEHLLHNQSALRLKARLLFQPRVMVTSVPWQLRLQPGRAQQRGRRTRATLSRSG